VGGSSVDKEPVIRYNPWHSCNLKYITGVKAVGCGGPKNPTLRKNDN